MIHVKFSSPALMGQPVRMTVAQGGVSRDLSVTAFGIAKTPPAGGSNGGETGTESGTGGSVVTPPLPPVPPVPPAEVGSGTATLTISTRRGQQQIAPEGMAFFAEVSGFDAQKPIDGKVYDPTLHDITYTWSFGDPGSFVAPENMLTEWRNKNVGYGPFPAHVFTRPGTYTVTCVATEKSSGKVATASIDVTVQDPEVVFAAATTVVCSTSGNFAGAPAHDAANRTTTLADAMARLRALKGNGQPVRLLLRAGEEFTMQGNNYIGSLYRNLHVTSFGSGRATIRATANGAIFQIWDSPLMSGASISRLALVGPWDSATETLNPAFPVGVKRPVGVDVSGGFCTVHDCTADGLWIGYSTGTLPGMTAIFSECQATNWEDYASYVGSEEEQPQGSALTGYVAHLGCRFHQHQQALQGGNGKSSTDLGNRHGVLRFHAKGFHYVDCLDGFTRNGWTVVAGVPVDQNIIRDHRNSPRSRGFFSRIMGEGGWQGYSNGPAAPDGGADGDGNGFYEPCNTVIDKAYFMGSARTICHLGLSSSAFTGRNLILHRPNVKTGADSFNKSIEIGTGQASFFSPACRTEPIRIHNVTIVNEMDDVQSAGKSWKPVEIRPGCYDPDTVQVGNTVVHQPNRTAGTVADMPLLNSRLGFASRYLGYRWRNHLASKLGDRLTMDTSFATPANPWSLWRPMAGSPAIGSATGLVAHDDLLGKVRPAKASRGAAEPA